MAGIVGLGRACALAAARLADDAPRVAALGQKLLSGLLALGARLNGDPDPGARLPGTVNVAFAGVEGETLLQALDLEGVCVSTGSACTSGTVAPSHVLTALGQPPEAARAAVRFSVGRGTTEQEIDAVLAMLPRLLARIRAAR